MVDEIWSPWLLRKKKSQSFSINQSSKSRLSAWLQTRTIESERGWTPGEETMTTRHIKTRLSLSRSRQSKKYYHHRPLAEVSSYFSRFLSSGLFFILFSYVYSHTLRGFFWQNLRTTEDVYSSPRSPRDSRLLWAHRLWMEKKISSLQVKGLLDSAHSSIRSIWFRDFPSIRASQALSSNSSRENHRTE